MKVFFRWLLISLSVFCVIMLIPRIISVISPGSPPVGYHFRVLDLLALGAGLESMVDRNPLLPADIEEIKDIEYKNINGKSLQLDIYRRKNLHEPVPLIVFIHGGGWRSGKRSDYMVYLIPFAQKGYITATVSYRLVKDSLYPACVEDVTDAVNWLRLHGNNYGIDTGRIALAGGSAGAHLAMLAAYGWKRNQGSMSPSLPYGAIKCIVDIYGPADLTTKYARTHPLVTGFLGHSWEEASELYHQASPLTWVHLRVPPTLILHGTSDELVPVSQSVMLEKKLRELNVPVEFYRLPLWPHTMDVVKRVNNYCQIKMTEFFRKYLSSPHPFK